MKHIVSFSGGKDSTAMLLMMIEKGMPVDEILFCDTGVEFPELYKHIEAVESYIGRSITRLKDEHDFWWWFGENTTIKGKHAGVKCGNGWPSMKRRWCTGRLKERPIQRHCRNHYHGEKVVEYIGIAFDEPKRYKPTETKKMPLYDWGVTEKQALEYCYAKGFDFGGLYNKFDRLGCYCCPLQGKKGWFTLYRDYPELWGICIEKERSREKVAFTALPNNKLLRAYEGEFEAKAGEQNLFAELLDKAY